MAEGGAEGPPPAQIVYSNDLAGVKIPTFDWEDPQVTQFKKFRRYCELILSTPTYSSRPGGEKVNYILLWLGPQGAEVYESPRTSM